MQRPQRVTLFLSSGGGRRRETGIGFAEKLSVVRHRGEIARADKIRRSGRSRSVGCAATGLDFITSREGSGILRKRQTAEERLPAPDGNPDSPRLRSRAGGAGGELG